MAQPEEQSWEINSAQLKFKESKVVMLSVGKLNPHPDNRPLGSSQEKIRQLKIMIGHDGFDSSHPLVVRPYMNGYQIIEGEHRFRAAKSLGYLELPCVIRDLNDTEALIQLVLGNIQTESKPLEIGLNALKVMQKDAENKYSVAEYAQRLGLSDTSIRRYMNASEVYRFIEQQVPEGVEVLDEVHKLEEVHRCAQSDWVWLHDFITKHNLSKVQVIDISQAIREIKTDQGEVYGLFDFIKIRQEIAEEIRKGGHALSEVYKELIKTTETSYENLDNELTLFEYNVLNDVIEEEQISLKEWYINNLKSLKNLTKQNVLEAYKDALQLKRSGAEEEAKRTAAYFQDKKNAKEREEQARIEREMRQVQPGEWWQLGRHYLYCGPGSDAVFRQQLPEHIALAYANPPQPKASQWDLDWLASQAEVSAISPPLDQIADFFRLTQMPYQWSMSAQLSMSKGDKGLGSWIYVALFGRKGINPKVVDHWKIDASDLKGNKTQDLLSHLLNAFSQEQEVVLDLYAGLGTMFMLAEDKRRICYGAEANPALCKELIEKWEDLSGDKARRVEKGG